MPLRQVFAPQIQTGIVLTDRSIQLSCVIHPQIEPAVHSFNAYQPNGEAYELQYPWGRITQLFITMGVIQFNLLQPRLKICQWTIEIFPYQEVNKCPCPRNNMQSSHTTIWIYHFKAHMSAKDWICITTLIPHWMYIAIVATKSFIIRVILQYRSKLINWRHCELI